MQARHAFCILVFLVFGQAFGAGAQPQPGDIVIIGIHSDGTDRFAWVPLVELNAGQEIFFTDAGWNATQNMFQRRINETADSTTTDPSGGAVRYTVPTGGLAAGTVVEVVIDSKTTGTPGAYALTVTGADADDFSAANDEDIVGGQGVSISTSGDQLIILIGSLLNPTFIFGVNTGANRWDPGSTTAQHASDVPAGLTNGETAVAIGIGPDAGDEVDNGRYVGPTSGAREEILAAVADQNNWETSDVDIEDLTNGTAAFDVLTGTGPSIMITPPGVDFGTVVLGSFTDAPVTLSNIGDADLEVSDIGFTDGNSGFSLPSGLDGPVAPGADSTITVRFTPMQSGMVLDTLFISHNAGDSPAVVVLRGTGVAPQDTTVTVALDTVFVAPGEETRLHITIVNETDILVGGLQFNLYLGDVTHGVIGETVEDMTSEGFEIKTSRSADGDTLKVVVFSTTGATIPSGSHVLGGLSFAADESPILDILGSASEIDLIDASLLVSDAFGDAIGSVSANGMIQIGIRSDVNTDGGIDIRDVVVFVSQLLGKDGGTLPNSGSIAFNIADGNEDGMLNVVDAVVIINRILDLPVGTPKMIAGGKTVIHLDETMILDDGQQAVPVLLESSTGIAGAQMAFSFDPAVLSVGAPRLMVEDPSGLAFDSHVADGVLRIVAYSMSADRGLDAGHTPVLLIPVTPVDDSEAVLTLSEILLVDRQAQPVPVTTDGISTTVATRTDSPDAFSLPGNYPNPFNPGTTIMYEVPQRAHITLTVYNLLGQEVLRLVDGFRTPGRHRAFWHGRNAQGQTVASGVYLYRLTSSTGFMETRRMTLVR